MGVKYPTLANYSLGGLHCMLMRCNTQKTKQLNIKAAISEYASDLKPKKPCTALSQHVQVKKQVLRWLKA